VVVVGASVSATDIARDITAVASLPVYSAIRSPHPVFGLKAFEHPRIVIKPAIKQIDSSNGRRVVIFTDGSILEDVDQIIFGTGYLFSLPFLPSFKLVDRRPDGFFQHVWKQGDPTLAMVGGVSLIQFYLMLSVILTEYRCLVDSHSELLNGKL
jgi:cation diffusion facilitator CzcD-associated flavoprotein CzcO